MALRIDIEPQQFVNDEKHILIVQLQVTHQLVRSICKETAKTLEERVNVSGTQLLHELLYLKRSLHFIKPGIERYQKLDETLFYLPIREAETIKAELLIISLYGEIPTLKNHRNGVFVAIDTIQDISISLYVRHAFQIVMITLQQFHKIGRRTRLKPIVTDLLIFESIQQTERIIDTYGVMRKMITVIILFQA